MTFSLTQISLVVLADSHNPTVLHPSFLKSQGIVPQDLELAEPPVCTQPLAIVKFQNGLVFVADPLKLQVQDNSSPTDVSSSPAPACAEKYLRALPLVRYKAVGINFTAAIDSENPEREVVERFLKDGPWATGDRVPRSMGIRLVYPMGDLEKSLQLSVDPGTIERDKGNAARAIILRANFHSELNADRTVEAAARAISRLPDCFSRFQEMSESFFPRQEP